MHSLGRAVVLFMGLVCASSYSPAYFSTQTQTATERVAMYGRCLLGSKVRESPVFLKAAVSGGVVLHPLRVKKRTSQCEMLGLICNSVMVSGLLNRVLHMYDCCENKDAGRSLAWRCVRTYGIGMRAFTQAARQVKFCGAA